MTEQTAPVEAPKQGKGRRSIVLWAACIVMLLGLIYIVSFFVMGMFFERQQYYTYVAVGNYTQFSTNAGFAPRPPLEDWQIDAMRNVNAFYRPLFAYTRYEPKDTEPLIKRYKELIAEVLMKESNIVPGARPDSVEALEFEHSIHISILISRRVIQYSYSKELKLLTKDP